MSNRRSLGSRGLIDLYRHCFSAAMGLEELDLRRIADYGRLHKFDSVLLAESGSCKPSGSIQAQPFERY